MLEGPIHNEVANALKSPPCIIKNLKPFGVFSMQPLSRVKPDALTNWGDPEAMSLRPKLAVKVARCIAQWTEIETHLGAFLGFLLHANQKAAVAMYSGVENRASQLRMIEAAAEASVPQDHFDVLSVLISSILRPVMKDRDKLAHWTWGHSDQLPDALLISEPAQTLDGLMRALGMFPGTENAAVPSHFDNIFVVRDPDLESMISRSMAAKEHLRHAMATVWDHNSREERARLLFQLSNVPQIREGLNRLYANRQKTQTTPSASPHPKQGEKP
jgi:hypothetical protein